MLTGSSTYLSSKEGGAEKKEGFPERTFLLQGVITSDVQCTQWVTVWVAEAGLPKATLAPTPRLGCDPKGRKCT